MLAPTYKTTILSILARQTKIFFYNSDNFCPIFFLTAYITLSILCERGLRGLFNSMY